LLFTSLEHVALCELQGRRFEEWEHEWTFRGEADGERVAHVGMDSAGQKEFKKEHRPRKAGAKVGRGGLCT
jgi:hypothetical protein